MQITEMATVMVPVGDQERALGFFVGTLGFEAVADFSYGDDDRWVEVRPAGSATRLSLARATAAGPAGVETGVAFTSADVEGDHAELRDRGIDVDGAILREGDPIVRWAGSALAGIPAMFRFRDPDGNSYLVVQQV